MAPSNGFGFNCKNANTIKFWPYKLPFYHYFAHPSHYVAKTYGRKRKKGRNNASLKYKSALTIYMVVPTANLFLDHDRTVPREVF